MIRTLALLALVASCKRSAEPAPKPPRDAAVDAAPAAPKAGLAFDPTDDGDLSQQLVFGPRTPRLPAVSADGQIASLESNVSGLMIPPPFALVIRPLANQAKAETLDLLDDDLASAAQSWGTAPPAAPIPQRLRERGTAALNRLQAGGFVSLVPIELAKPAIPGHKLEVVERDDESIELVLRDATGAVQQREPIATYTEGSFNGGDGQVACLYRPWARDAYLDAAGRHLYLTIIFRWHEECDPAVPRFVVFDLAAKPTPEVAIANVVDQQFDVLQDVDHAAHSFTADAQLINTAGAGTPDDRTFRVAEHHELYVHHLDRDVTITLARDGKTAWASLTTKLEVLPQNQASRADPWRASDVLVQTPAGWRIAAAVWSEPRANAAVNRDARAGKLPALPDLEGPDDAELTAAFAALITSGADPAADLVAIGSGPGERTVGGAAFARGWNAGWKGHVEVTSKLARRAPSGTTGWVVANVWLAKPGYRIPFQVFCVFDRAATGWQLVHVHFAV